MTKLEKAAEDHAKYAVDNFEDDSYNAANEGFIKGAIWLLAQAEDISETAHEKISSHCELVYPVADILKLKEIVHGTRES